MCAARSRDRRRRKRLVLVMALARQAVEAAANRPPRHRLDDQAYLRHLEGMLGEQGGNRAGRAAGSGDCA